MKAALLRAFGAPLTWEDVDTPRPGADDVLIQVMACGTDGTDLKLLDGFGYRPELPFIMGHEPAGLITEVGASVRDFHVGDRVISYNFFHSKETTVFRRFGRKYVHSKPRHLSRFNGRFDVGFDYELAPSTIYNKNSTFHFRETICV